MQAVDLDRVVGGGTGLCVCGTLASSSVDRLLAGGRHTAGVRGRGLRRRRSRRAGSGRRAAPRCRARAWEGRSPLLAAERGPTIFSGVPAGAVTNCTRSAPIDWYVRYRSRASSLRDGRIRPEVTAPFAMPPRLSIRCSRNSPAGGRRRGWPAACTRGWRPNPGRGQLSSRWPLGRATPSALTARTGADLRVALRPQAALDRKWWVISPGEAGASRHVRNGASKPSPRSTRSRRREC